LYNIKKLFNTIIIIGWLIFTVLFFSFAILKTLIPLYDEKNYKSFVLNIIGILILYTAILMLIYRGFILVKDTFLLLSEPNFNKRVELLLRNKFTIKEEKKKNRLENTKLLFKIWRKGAKWLAFGLLLIIIGGIIINL